MPLTPADVHNVAFSKPPIGKRGYNEDEVDAFLDLVEAELGASTTSAARSRRRGEGGADASADASSDERSDERSDALESEIGDLLFAVANLARHLGIDPERALAGTNAKFRRRFGHLERRLSEQGRGVDGAGLDELEALWQEAKAAEGADGEVPRRHPPRD